MSPMTNQALDNQQPEDIGLSTQSVSINDVSEPLRQKLFQALQYSVKEQRQPANQELILSSITSDSTFNTPTEVIQKETLPKEPPQRPALPTATPSAIRGTLFEGTPRIRSFQATGLHQSALTQERTRKHTMADLSGYKDLSKAPMPATLTSPLSDMPSYTSTALPTVDRDFDDMHPAHHEMDSEFSNNVKTLIKLVNDLPPDVSRQTGAQIIRLTMEAMGISMENVLSEAQTAQSEMLESVRSSIKKIEEYKTVIRKLETDIKYFQGRANELSEIIDLFILSNTSNHPGSDSGLY